MDENVRIKLEDFFDKYKHLTFKKGEILIRADDDPPGVFYLKKGTVRQYSISKEGEEQTLTLYKPISYFPMMWVINNISNSYYFEALTEVEVFRAPREEVLKFIKSEPEVLFDLTSRLYSGMHGLLTRIEYLLFNSAYNKILYTLINNAIRFGTKENEEIHLHMTHKDIAAFSGLTKETISREVKRLEEKGLIKNKNNLLIIPDMKQLEDELLN
jgi:CRP/FNR family transcriptional regulator, anaerobic regulatory protein